MNSKKNHRASIPPLERPKICLILDSNLLYTTDNGKLASREFERVMNDYRKAADIDVYLPRLVIEERVQQTYEVALEVLESLRASGRRLNMIANLDTSSAFPEPQKVRKEVENRYEVWKETLGIRILETPTQQLDLSEIIDRAVKKIGVFEGKRTLKIKDEIEYLEVKEKGFKDFIIQRTVEHSLPTIGIEKYQKVVIGTDDEKLRKEFRATESKRIEVLGKWSEILENLATFLSNLTEEQIDRIRPICEEAFRKQLLPKISNQLSQAEANKTALNVRRSHFPDYINAASTIALRGTNFLLQIPPTIRVQEIETIFIGKESSMFRWKTTLEVSRADVENSYLPLLNVNDRFECEWAAELSDSLALNKVESTKEPVKVERRMLGFDFGDSV